MLILDRMLVGSIKFVLGKLAAAVEQELDDDTALRERLLEAQMRLEVGDLSAEEFADLEASILERLREIQQRRGGGQGMAVVAEGMQIAGIEAEFAADEVHEAAMGGTVEAPAAKPKAPAAKPRARKARAARAAKRKRR